MRSTPLAVALTVTLTLLVAGRAAAQPSTPASLPQGVELELLGGIQPDAFPGHRLELARVTLAPGSVLPRTTFDGTWLVRVMSGSMTVVALDGPAWTQAPDRTESEPIGSADGVTVSAGTVVGFGPDAVLTWQNVTDEPVTLLASAMVDEEADPILSAAQQHSPAGLQPPVVDRFVLTGPGTTGDRYRIVVADRSGRVIGARVPRERELRFSGSTALLDYRDVAIGPTAFVRRGAHEMLIRWGGTPCGPIVRVDVAADLSAIRVIDRTPGCDAMGMAHWLVLRLRGGWIDPDDIEGSWIRR
jgi:quercetin dioxygenase-like cupin family protein